MNRRSFFKLIGATAVAPAGTVGIRKLFPALKRFLPCEGQELSRSQYSKLASIMGSSFGGDGVTTFNLPNLKMEPIKGNINITPIGYYIDTENGMIIPMEARTINS